MVDEEGGAIRRVSLPALSDVEEGLRHAMVVFCKGQAIGFCRTV